MTGYDAQKYEQAKKSCEDLGLKFEIIGDVFSIEKHGRFPNIAAVLFYLYGYEKGKGEKS